MSPLQYNTKLQPALSALSAFIHKLPFKAFIEISSEIKIPLKLSFFLIIFLIIYVEKVAKFFDLFFYRKCAVIIKFEDKFLKSLKSSLYNLFFFIYNW